MDGQEVAPDWPHLRLEELSALLRRYPRLRGARAILSHSPRPFSSASLVATGAGTVFVKRHALAVRGAADLCEEHAFMAHLRGKGIPVCEVIATADGRTAVEADGWSYEVHSLAPGEDIYRDLFSWKPFFCTGHAREAGAMLARLHCAAEDYSAAPRRSRILVSSFSIFSQAEPMPALARYLEACPGATAYLEKFSGWRETFAALLLPLHERLRPFLPLLAPLWTHNDLHASNLTYGSAGDDALALGVIDFGLACQTCALFDLATAIERNAIDWLEMGAAAASARPGLVHWDQLRALLDGYHGVRPLAPEEWLALAELLPLVHVEYALSELEYFASVLHSEPSAALAYSYLFEHARWFASPEGSQLLETLRAQADMPLDAPAEALEPAQ